MTGVLAQHGPLLHEEAKISDDINEQLVEMCQVFTKNFQKAFNLLNGSAEASKHR